MKVERRKGPELLGALVNQFKVRDKERWREREMDSLLYEVHVFKVLEGERIECTLTY